MLDKLGQLLEIGWWCSSFGPWPITPTHGPALKQRNRRCLRRFSKWAHVVCIRFLGCSLSTTPGARKHDPGRPNHHWHPTDARRKSEREVAQRPSLAVPGEHQVSSTCWPRLVFSRHDTWCMNVGRLAEQWLSQTAELSATGC